MKNQNGNAAWAARNQQVREWLLTHPHLIDEGMWHESIRKTDRFRDEMQEEIKNSQRAGRESLKDKLKRIVSPILARRRADAKW
ncbi:hypothetical protein EBB07_00080 [Paenibacillaceae bacterium]|nr:hypothetical protein EBB07_00080 [Paenibacillaceae bacterium]